MTSNVAILPLVGVLTSDYSALLGTVLRALADDPLIDKIVAYVDSPGGSVSGTGDLAQEIRSAAAKKPVIAFVRGTGASAAFWAISGATEIVASPSAYVGSLGVVGSVIDSSKAAEDAGLKVHVISSSPIKGGGIPGAKVTDEYLAEQQRLIESMTDSFKAAVMSGRKLSKEKADSLFDGRLHIAADAVKLGLVDRVGDLSSILKDKEESPMSDPIKTPEPTTNVVAQIPTPAPVPVVAAPVTVGTQASVVAPVFALTVAEVSAMAKSLVDAGCPLSAESISARLTASKSFDEATDLMLKLSKIPSAKALGGFAPKENTPAGTPAATAPVRTKAQVATLFSALVTKHKTAGLSGIAAVKAATAEDPELHKAYLAAYNTTQE